MRKGKTKHIEGNFFSSFFSVSLFFTLVQEIESRLNSIQKEFKTAIAEKTKLELEAEKTALAISLAHRLVNGLGSEAIRWHQSVEK